MTLTFTDRASYLVACAAWRTLHRERIDAVRQLKLDLKTAQRTFDRVGRDMGRREAYLAMVSARRAHLETVAAINGLVATRRVMRAEAQRQYLAARASG